MLYLIPSRPDIILSVCLCVRFQSYPKETHLNAVKRIIKYLKGMIKMGLWYPKIGHYEMASYSNADYACCRVDRKSTSWTFQFLGYYLISWSSKKQKLVALSTAEAEYMQPDLVMHKFNGCNIPCKTMICNLNTS